MYSPKHGLPAARKRRPLLNRIIGLSIASGATLVAGVSLSPTAQADGSVWDRVAACEGGGNWAASTGNGFSGGLQFSGSTWRAYGGSRYGASAGQASKAAQIAVAGRVLAAQGPGAWPSCGRLAGLTRGNSGGSNVAVSRSRARVAIRPATQHRARPATQHRARPATQHRARPATQYTARPATRHGAPTPAASPVSSRLRVDGQMGPRTVSAIQRWVGVSRTGTFGPGTVRALQRTCGAYSDGVLGLRTIHALQVRIGVVPDGARHLNAATVAALQRYLNTH